MDRDKIVRFCLAAGIALSSVGILRVGVWPMDVPAAAALNPSLEEILADQGWRRSTTLPPQTGQTVSRAQGYKFTHTLHGNSARPFRLTLIPARVRGAKDFDALTIRNASLGKLKHPTRTIWKGRDELVLIEAANEPLALLSCLSNGEARSSSNALVQLKLEKDPANTASSRLRMMAGLQQPREWSCLLVELKAADRATTQNDLLDIWSTVQTSLQGSKGVGDSPDKTG